MREREREIDIENGEERKNVILTFLERKVERKRKRKKIKEKEKEKEKEK